MADNETHIHKLAIAGPDYVCTKGYQAIEAGALKALDPTIALIGHNRYATLGKITNKTAHPFRHNSITGVHNGTLYNHEELAGGKGASFTIDSEAVMFALSTDAPKTVLEGMVGAFALVWHDQRDNSLNFARNDERPLTFAVSADKGVVLWASEELMLKWLVGRTYEHSNFDFVELPIGEHWKFDLNSWSSVYNTKEVIKFDSPSWRNQWLDNYYPQHLPRATNLPDRLNITTNLCDTDIVIGGPVQELDLKPGHSYEVVVEEFGYYRAAEGRHGRAKGFLIDGVDNNIMTAIGMADDQYTEGETLSVNIPHNYHVTATGEILLIATSHRRPPPSPIGIKVGSVHMKLAEYEKAVADGCGWCGDLLVRSEAHLMEVITCGNNDTVITCPTCTNEIPWDNKTGEIYDKSH